MTDLIDRNELLKVFEEDCSDNAWWFIDQVENAPTVEAEPVVHAHWIKMKDDDPDDFRCSNCKAIAPIDEEAVLRTGKIHRFCSPRCMWCGAVMKGKEFEL